MLSQKKAFRRNARYYKGPLPNRRPNRPLRARVSVPRVRPTARPLSHSPTTNKFLPGTNAVL